MLDAVQNLRIEYGIWQECSFNVTNFVRIDLLLVHKRTSLTDDIPINSVSCFLVLNFNFYTGWPCDRLKNNCVERYSIDNCGTLHIMIPLKIVIILSFILVSHFTHTPTVTYSTASASSQTARKARSGLLKHY